MADYYAIPQPHRERRRPTGAGDCQIGRWFVGHNVLMSFCWRLQMFGQSTQFIRICRRNSASASQCACCGRSDVYGLFCIHLSADIYTKWPSRSPCATAFKPQAGRASPWYRTGRPRRACRLAPIGSWRWDSGSGDLAAGSGERARHDAPGSIEAASPGCRVLSIGLQEVEVSWLILRVDEKG